MVMIAAIRNFVMMDMRSDAGFRPRLMTATA